LDKLEAKELFLALFELLNFILFKFFFTLQLRLFRSSFNFSRAFFQIKWYAYLYTLFLFCFNLSINADFGIEEITIL